ncbi:MAG: S8 family serine peptidase [Chloroflexota bacterium]
MRRLLGVLAMVGLLAMNAAPAAARTPRSNAGLVPLGSPTVSSTYVAAKSASGSIAQSDTGLLSRSDRQMVRIIVKMDVDALASYSGGRDGMAATSPTITGKSLKAGGTAVNVYNRFLSNKATTIRSAAQRAVPGMTLGRNFLVAFGGFAAELPANKARELLRVPGVVAVMYDTVNHPTANDSPNFVGAPAVWSSLGGEATAGQGVKVGVLDTGIWPEHPMLADPGIPNPGGGPYDCDFGTSGETNDAAFACNDKLIGAYAFLNTNVAVTGYDTDEYCTASGCTARDADGHGTHTSTTAAGSPVDHAVVNGTDYGHISGIAPGASVIMYRVCDADGCFSTDSMDAVEQAILDDIDVINFSISGGANAYSDGVELAFLDAYAAGIMVNASAGNSGPGAATTDHGGGWTNTVGASTLDRAFATTLHLAATGGATLDMAGVTVSGGVTSPTPVVLGSATVSGLKCDTAASSGDYAGVVVVCQRGTNARIAKGYNVSLGDAEGMILYNTTATDLETDNHFLPAVHVNDPSSTIAAFVSGHTGVTATWTNGVPTAAQGDVMASFSSRGPLGDFIKPDVTAPGVQILAGNSPQHLDDPDGGLGPDGELYQAIAGTSMSSPHAAGVAALLKAAHPSWTPGQIKSAMMTSAAQGVVKEDGVTPSDPFDRGGGSIRVNKAVNPTVTFDVTAPQYFAAANDPFSRINLNLASVNAPNMPGQITTTRTARNVTGVSQTIKISASANIIVTPSTITLGPWGSASFWIKIDGQKLADGQYFGKITLDPVKAGYINAILPVAWDKQPGDITLSNECDAPVTFTAQQLTINKGETAQCHVSATNYNPVDAHVQIQVKAPNTGRLIIKNWTDGNKKGNGFIWNGTLDASLPPAVLALVSPGDGFYDISGDVAAVGAAAHEDEAIVNFALGSAVRFGDVEYDTIGMTTDGYLVVGGGEAADVAYEPQDMPDPSRPNNVLAPYWTDLTLDPASGGGAGDFYVGAYGCGGGPSPCAYAFEWKGVKVYGQPLTRTFQVWMYTAAFLDYVGATDDDYITFEYSAAQSGPSAVGVPLNIGAEDALGLTAAQLGPDSTGTLAPDTTTPCLVTGTCGGYFIVTGDSTPGGTITIDYDAFGKKTGNFDVKAMMTSDVSQGTDFQIVKIHVVNAGP